MAFASSNLKLTQVQAVVRVSGTGGDSGSIDLDVDLLKASETASSPSVNISAVHWYCDKNAEVTITRNGVDILHLHDSDHTDWYGFAENTENDQDINISFSNGDAVIILELAKVDGYGPVQHQGADGNLGAN